MSKKQAIKVTTDDYKWAILNAAEQMYDLSLNLLSVIPAKTKVIDKVAIQNKLEQWNKLLSYYNKKLKRL